MEVEDLGVQLPSGEMRRFRLARSLLHFWYVWGLLVVGLCLGAATVLK